MDSDPIKTATHPIPQEDSECLLPPKISCEETSNTDPSKEDTAFEHGVKITENKQVSEVLANAIKTWPTQEEGQASRRKGSRGQMITRASTWIIKTKERQQMKNERRERRATVTLAIVLGKQIIVELFIETQLKSN